MCYAQVGSCSAETFSVFRPVNFGGAHRWDLLVRFMARRVSFLSSHVVSRSVRSVGGVPACEDDAALVAKENMVVLNLLALCEHLSVRQCIGGFVLETDSFGGGQPAVPWTSPLFTASLARARATWCTCQGNKSGGDTGVCQLGGNTDVWSPSRLSGPRRRVGCALALDTRLVGTWLAQQMEQLQISASGPGRLSCGTRYTSRDVLGTQPFGRATGLRGSDKRVGSAGRRLGAGTRPERVLFARGRRHLFG